jgi:hypothetical protein
MTAAFVPPTFWRPSVEGPIGISARPIGRPTCRQPDSRAVVCLQSESVSDDNLADNLEPSVDAAPAAWAPKLDEKCTYCNGEKVVECPVCRYRSTCFKLRWRSVLVPPKSEYCGFIDTVRN